MNLFWRIKKYSAWWMVGIISLASLGLMLHAAWTDSAIDDELAHIPAGYGYVSQLDYRLNPEHPPLVKALALAPVLLLQPTFPTQSQAWQSGVNNQWGIGTQFLYQSGNDATAIIRTARILPILLTILTIIMVYLLARRMLGAWWGLLPAFLFAFDPTVLAHGHYVTTDMGATFAVVGSLYFYLRFISSPSRTHLIQAGLVFGAGQLMKFSTPLISVILLFLAFVLWLRERFAWKHLAHWILIVLIGYLLVVYPAYFLFTAHYPMAKQASDTAQILTSFSTGPTSPGSLCHGMRCLADLDIWMSKHYSTRPYAEYLLGILMVLQRSDGGNTIYFLGRVVNSGGWIYFPTLLLLKEPIPTLIMVFVAFVLSLWWGMRRQKKFAAAAQYLHKRFDSFSLASFIVLYWGYSMHSRLNIGIRHILPTLPLIFILAAFIWKTWITRTFFPSEKGLSIESLAASVQKTARAIGFSAAKYIALIILLAWLTLETLFASPYFLSYFNQFAGGTMNGYRYVTDSNYDWGQDLWRLQTWVDAYNDCANGHIDVDMCNSKILTLLNHEGNTTKAIDKIAVDYFGGGNAHYYLGDREIDWQSSKGDPTIQGIHWLAVSVNQLQGAIQPLASGKTRNATDTYAWLTVMRPPAAGMGSVPSPDTRIGTSIFVYHLSK